jgi:hypothetical protein
MRSNGKIKMSKNKLISNLNNKRFILWLVSLMAVIAVSLVSPISQSLDYHNFSDSNSFIGIPNSLNVISNLAFILVGMYSIVFVIKNKDSLDKFYWSSLIYGIGIFFVGLGSGYYHWTPDNDTLLFDRLPMTIAFMSFYAMIVSAFIKPLNGLKLLPWLLLAGGISVWYWVATEEIGKGDLRWYALVQFLPMILIAVILALFESKDHNKSLVFSVMGWYFIAKIFEFIDSQVYEITGVISGHSLKHIFAAIACLYIVKWIRSLLNKQI